MKTLKEVLTEKPEYKTLIRAVINSIGMKSVEDVNNNGIDGGYGNFIYYADTVKFYRKHKKDILKLADEMADSLGEDLLTMIQHFNCLTDKRINKPDYTQSEIGEAIFSGNGDDAVEQILNAMAWFAAEEVCRMFED